MALEQASMTCAYETVLMDYAAGTLDEAQSLVVATHLTLSPVARRKVGSCEAIGGALLEEGCGKVALKQTALDELLARIESKTDIRRAGACPPSRGIFPSSVCAYLAGEPGWKTIYPGLKTADISTACNHSRASLMKLDPGAKAPEHTHRGLELTLVLEGVLEDGAGGRYVRGDLIVADESVIHRPAAGGSEGCICLVAANQPVRLTGWLGRILNPFLKA